MQVTTTMMCPWLPLERYQHTCTKFTPRCGLEYSLCAVSISAYHLLPLRPSCFDYICDRSITYSPPTYLLPSLFRVCPQFTRTSFPSRKGVVNPVSHLSPILITPGGNILSVGACFCCDCVINTTSLTSFASHRMRSTTVDTTRSSIWWAVLSLMLAGTVPTSCPFST